MMSVSRASVRQAVVLAACLAVPVTAPVAVAQQMLLNEDGQPVNDPTANTVFVRDSGVATERLALAERLEGQKEWNKSADVYGEVMQKFADRVVPSKKDKDGKPTQYISAARLVQDRIARWPAEGLEAYRRRFEDTARELLNTDDPAAPAKVADGYFVTDAGRDAALKVIASAFEAGDFTSAAGMGRRLLDLHPGLVAERPAVLLRTGIAEHLAGRAADAQSRLSELQQKYPDALARVAGVDTKAADALAVALDTPAEASSFRSEDWPTAFGTPDASAVPEQVSTGGARLFGVDLPSATARAGAAGNLRSYQKIVDRDRKQGLSTGILPSVDGGALFFQDNAHVYAIGLASGMPLPGWQQSYANTPRNAFAIDAVPMPRGKQLAVSVTPQSVVALLGQVDLSAVQQLNYPVTPPQVVSLDRNTGKRQWSQQPQKLKLPDDLTNLRDGVFYGSPVVDGDTVYVLLNANRNGQFEECHVVALRLSDGAYKWSTYVASTSFGSRFFGDDFEGNFSTGTPAALSMSAGRLFVTTNLGAIACLDAPSGNVRWLNVYARNPGAANERRLASFQARLPSGKPFLNGPPIVADGRVFVLPNDANSLFVYDADDGSLVRELPKKIDPDTNKFQPVTTLLAVVDDSLVLANQAAVFKLPWQSFDATKSLIDNGGRYKNFPAGKDEPAQNPPNSLRGRPFVSHGSVLVPTSARLYRVSLKSFNIEGEYPQQGEWDEDESTGNILATPENLIIAGAQQVSVYADLKAATAKLDARINADPNDVEAYLRYAELLFSAGQPTEALAKVDAAAEKLGGLTSLTPGPMRDRLFEIVLAFAAKLTKDDGELALQTQVFDRAAASALSPSQQVRYRLARATAYRAESKSAEEVSLHQEILAKPEWRTVTVTGTSGASTAAAEAEAAISDLIRVRGADVYAAYEAQATERLEALRSAEKPDADALLALADEFPLAKVTPDAMSQAADSYEAADQPRLATQTLRRLLKRELSNERRQVTLQALARNYLASPSQVAIARVRLLQAKAQAPSAKLEKPLTLPDGKPVVAETVAEAVAALDGYAAIARAQSLPKIGLPADSYGKDDRPALLPATEIAAAMAILKQPADQTRTDRIVVWGADRRVGVVTTATGAVQWTDAAPTEEPTGAGFAGDLLVVTSPGETYAVDAAGKVLWKVAAASLPPVELTVDTSVKREGGGGPMAQNQVLLNRRLAMQQRLNGRFGVIQALPEPAEENIAGNAERFTQFRLLSDRVVLATSTGRVMAIDLTRGTTAWQNRVNEAGATRLLSTDDFVAAGFIDPANGSEAYVFDAVTGQTVLHKSYDGNTNPQAGGLINLALSPDGVLVTMQAGRLTAVDLYDPGSGDRKYDAANARGNAIVAMPFIQSTLEDQLVISGDKVLAVYSGMTGQQQSVHVYDLRTMRAVTITDPKTKRETEVGFGARRTDNDGAPMRILASGSMFYAVGQRSVWAFDVQQPTSDARWDNLPIVGNLKPVRDTLLAQDYLLQLAPATRVNLDAERLPGVRLSMYSRARLQKDTESGLLEQMPVIQEPAGIVANKWQLADGAFFYVTGDNKLKVARVNQ